MTARVDGKLVLPINLDALGAPRRPSMSATGILTIVLLCIAIVVVLAYVVNLAVQRKRRSGVHEEIVIEPVTGASVAAAFAPEADADADFLQEDEPVLEERFDAPRNEIAVGAVTTAAPLPPPRSVQPMGLQGDAVGAADPMGNLLSSSVRMEGPGGPSGLSLSSVMPASWRGPSTGTAGALDAYFGPLSGAAPGAFDASQAALFASAAPTRELTVNAILQSNAVDRAGFANLRPTNKPGVDTTFGIRPVASGISLSGSAPVFNASDAQMEAIKTATGGNYPVFSLSQG